MERLLLRPHEAAEVLGVSRSQLYRLVKLRQIPACRVGKSLRLSVPTLQEWAMKKGLELTKPKINEKPPRGSSKSRKA